jgi:hypothetical protein
MEQLQLTAIAGGNVNLHFGKLFGTVYQSKNAHTLYPTILTPQLKLIRSECLCQTEDKNVPTGLFMLLKKLKLFRCPPKR